jgi:hypothetical protein
MSKTNLPAVLAVPTSDFTEHDNKKLAEYRELGLPGVVSITEAQLFRMYDLYLGGCTYSQISNMLEIKRNIVLYYSHTNKWYEARTNYLAEVQEKIKNRVADTKIRNKEFMLLLVQAWQKKIGGKLTRYLATNDSQHMDEVDLKEVAQLMKAIDMINELDEEGKNKQGKTPPIGLNVGQGVTLQRDGDKLSITPNAPSEESLGNILQKYADESRKKEKQIAIGSSDIDKERGENNENE